MNLLTAELSQVPPLPLHSAIIYLSAISQTEKTQHHIVS